VFQGVANGMSCPVFVGAGTLLGEDACTWIKVSGSFDSSSGQHAESVGTHLGGQLEVAPGWFVGGALGFTRPSMTLSFGHSSTGSEVDAALVVKRVDGALLLAAGLGFATSNRQFVRPAEPFAIGSGSMTSSVSTFTTGMRLRGAYQLAFEQWYLRPRADIDLGWSTRSPVIESGPGLPIALDGSSKFDFTLGPALEIGGRYDVADAILRPYASVGVTYQPDTTQTITGNIYGTPFWFATKRPNVVGILEAGLQVYRAKGWEMKAEYRLTEVEWFAFMGHTVSARVSKHF